MPKFRCFKIAEVCHNPLLKFCLPANPGDFCRIGAWKGQQLIVLALSIHRKGNICKNSTHHILLLTLEGEVGSSDDEIGTQGDCPPDLRMLKCAISLLKVTFPSCSLQILSHACNFLQEKNFGDCIFIFISTFAILCFTSVESTGPYIVD